MNGESMGKKDENLGKWLITKQQSLSWMKREIK
jgi:hypothetical protein